jgi:hypothetical protein
MTRQTKPTADSAHLRGLEAEHLQEIEGNPLTAQERELFAQFEREGWSTERQRAFILTRLGAGAADHAAE